MLCDIGQQLKDAFKKATLSLGKHVDAYKGAVKDSDFQAEAARLEKSRHEAQFAFSAHQDSCPICKGR
jgi:hypothetical protein